MVPSALPAPRSTDTLAAAPVVVDTTCSRYEFAPTCTALAVTPRLALLIPLITDWRLPSPTSTLVVVAPLVTLMGPEATTADRFATVPSDRTEPAEASWSTVKDTVPGAAPWTVVAVAMAELDEVALVIDHWAAVASASAAPWTAAILVLTSW